MHYFIFSFLIIVVNTPLFLKKLTVLAHTFVLKWAVGEPSDESKRLLIAVNFRLAKVQVEEGWLPWSPMDLAQRKEWRAKGLGFSAAE